MKTALDTLISGGGSTSSGSVAGSSAQQVAVQPQTQLSAWDKLMQSQGIYRQDYPDNSPVASLYDTLGSSVGSAGQVVQNGAVGASGTVQNLVNSASSDFSSVLDSVNNALDSFQSGITSSADAANAIARENTQSAQQFALKQMQASAAIQRELRRTAYQDTVHSLREAGLNPMLAYMNGAVSASAPSSSVSASQTFQEHQNIADNIISVIKLIADVFGSVTSAVKGMTN